MTSNCRERDGYYRFHFCKGCGEDRPSVEPATGARLLVLGLMLALMLKLALMLTLMLAMVLALVPVPVPLLVQSSQTELRPLLPQRPLPLLPQPLRPLLPLRVLPLRLSLMLVKPLGLPRHLQVTRF